MSEGGMTLRQVVQRLDSYNDELMIWARVQTKDDLTPDTEAVVAPARQDDSTWWEERGLSYVLEVDVAKEAIEVWRQGAIEHCGNRRRRVERLVSAWNRAVSEADTPAGEPEDPLIEASAEPRRRPRTPLTDEEVDAMRTARANGISVIALANQHGIHRGTVWAKTRGV